MVLDGAELGDLVYLRAPQSETNHPTPVSLSTVPIVFYAVSK